MAKNRNVCQEWDFEEESESDEEQLMDSNPGTSLNCFQKFRRPDKETTPPSNTWTRFGTVKHLVIYPIDRGSGLREPSVICTQTGPEFDSEHRLIRRIKDRALVIYKAGQQTITLNPQDVMVNWDRKMCFYYGNIKQNRNNTIDLKEMTYDNNKIPVYVRYDNEYCQQLIMNYRKKNENLRIGYFQPEDRSIFNSTARYVHEKWNISGMHANYSHYTLINTRSVDAFIASFNNKMKEENRKIRSKHFNYFNFFPHIVVEGDFGTQFQEDSVLALKIGNVEFGHILPCIHYENDLKLNHTSNDKLFKFIYNSLKEDRALKTHFSEYHHDDSELPVFGLNMEKTNADSYNDEHNQISENDIVYVKFRDSSNPLASNPP